jgi:transcriptional regulator with XRE-family HTH domain
MGYITAMVNPVTELKKHQRARGLSQDELARSMDVSAGYLSMLLSGAREPGPKVLQFLRLEKQVVTKVTYRRINGTKP